MTTLLTPYMTLLIAAAAAATFVTRIGGYILVKRLKQMPPRLEAALNAVPAAVLTTLVAPAFFYGQIDVKVAMVAAFLIGLRYPPIPMLIGGWAAVMLMRQFLG
ncbi:putative membrane protein [Rhizobium rosettiformans]|uniref:AzlD family protein n=2 Tax=Rhizobium rosettiformans TaxID=1368430 RepID=A0A4S8PNK6_9HYPH|nr:AzlD family protein [Rhizobium rosettiformans]MBB5278319.1 putative membrane protein [Rhizobium rosettiformans]THV31761.1 AzlD family protein [Rhizobium rosettiformans W3]